MGFFPPHRRPLASLFLIAPFFLWGTAMVAMKGTLPQTTPLFVATLRLVPAGALILLFGLVTGRSQPQGWKAWAWIGLFALIDGALFQGFLAEGLERTDAGLGSVMIDSQPLAVALMAGWLFGEYIGWFGGIGLGVGVLGISLLGLPESWILNGLEMLGSGRWWDIVVQSSQQALSWDIELMQTGVLALFRNGQWLMLLASLSMATGTILSRYVFQESDPVMATGWHMVLGGLPLLGLSAGLETHQWQALMLGDVMALAYATVFGSAIAYGLFFYFASRGNLTSLSALTFLTPVFALLFGSLFLEERLNNVQTTGVLLTLISIYFVNQREMLAQWVSQFTHNSEKNDKKHQLFTSIGNGAEVKQSGLKDETPSKS